MTDKIVPFDFNGFEIRTIGGSENPLFVAVDVCGVLEIGDTSQACEALDDDEKLVRALHVSGQSRDVLCITESGLYSLVLRSRKPQAKVFKKWLTSEVIPSIRKTGSYAVKQMSGAEMIIYQGQMLLKIEQQQAAIQIEQQEMKAEQAKLKATILLHDAEIGRIFEPDGMLITLAGFLSMKGVHATAAQLASAGKAASKIYKAKYGKKPEKIGDARYGQVNAYPRRSPSRS